MFAVLSLVIGLAAVVMAVLLPFGIAYDRRLRQQRRSTALGATGRPRVVWQAGRWDTDPNHAYVANIGDDTAYDVSVTAYDRVVGLARSVPPCRPDWMLASSELPCYLSFRVEGRPDNAVDDLGRTGVAVLVSWRSETDDWCTQTVRAEGPVPTPQVALR
ncbi:MAG: hypothetical protein WAN71_00565 [Mycobacterium sp.]|uniref:hypothetical protein n=1 Tax=Mycobacterium sp. TaxID=1785 RepID=UPI003BB18485